MITYRQSVTHLNDISEIPGPIFFKFHMEPYVNRGFKICSYGHHPVIKIAGQKHLKIFFSRTKKALGPMHLYGENDEISFTGKMMKYHFLKMY